MSGVARALEPAAPAPKTIRRPDLSEDDQKELALLDAIFGRITKHVPASPYILSTPSLNEYRRHPHQDVGTWMMGGFFRPDEEHLQYRTFHYREPYQDCFVLQNGEESNREVQRPRSQASATSHSGPKQTISYSAYKSKQTNGALASGSKKPSPALPPVTSSSVITNGAKDPVAAPLSSSQPDQATSPKRPAEEPLVSAKPEKRAREDKPTVQAGVRGEKASPSAKGRQLSPSNGTPHGLPTMLSPIDPPLHNPYGLPSLLSPTLPSNVQAELDRLEIQRKRGDSNASASSSDRKSQLLSVPESRPQKQMDSSKSDSQVPSVSVNGKPSSDAALGGGRLPERRLIVKLRYGKKRSATINNILRLPPSRKAQSALEKKVDKKRPETAPERSVKAQSKPVDGIASQTKTPKATPRRNETTTPAASATAKAPQKRPRSEDDPATAHPPKRSKLSPEAPRTPSQQIVSSPALSNRSSAQKKQVYNTPRKDLKSINMLRTHSAESHEATPGRSGSTPAGAKYVDAKATPTSVPLGAEPQALAITSQTLNDLGRSLKHLVQRMLHKQREQAAEEDRKHVAVTSLECILSYTAAYAIQDQVNSLRGRTGDVEATWKTLVPLCMSYAALTKKFPHLDGLRLRICSVICALICEHTALRAPRTKPEDPLPETQIQERENNHALIAQHYLWLKRTTLEAHDALSDDDIRLLYPKTFAGSEEKKKPPRPEKIAHHENLSGPYWLPINMGTAPIEVVRFAKKFLAEYVEKQKLDYDFHLSLERPD